MSGLRIFPDPALRKKTKPVLNPRTAPVQELIRKMVREMKSQPHGIGIAAPQIGIDLSIAIVDVSLRVPGAERLVVINPKILEIKEETLSREGCMSIPDYRADIKRYRTVKASWMDEKGKERLKTMTGIEAICFQHEADHLNGILFIDHVVNLKRDLIPRKP